MKKCPICQSAAMAPEGQSVIMSSVLRRWEKEIGHSFSQNVWDEYVGEAERPISLMQCSECGFGQFFPVLPGSEEFYKEISAIDYYNEDKWEFQQAALDINRRGARSVLDVGCGSGIFLKFLKRETPNINLSGFDLNTELLNKLSEEGFGVLHNDPLQFKQAMAGKPLFDVITMLQVLEHVADPVEFIETFLPLLRPGGLLIITTPNFDGPIKAFPDALTEVPPHHTTRWTEKAFRHVLAAQKMNVRSVLIEPLPQYLWDTYLPEMWDTNIWPAQIFDPIARMRGLTTIGERSGMAANKMKEMGIRWIEGVPGHTVYVSSSKEEATNV